MNLEAWQNMLWAKKTYESTGIADRCEGDDAWKVCCQIALRAFHNQDWGDMDDEDKASNDNRVKLNAGTVMGQYYGIGRMPFYERTKFWIIWDGTCTTILFPSEY